MNQIGFTQIVSLMQQMQSLQWGLAERESPSHSIHLRIHSLPDSLSPRPHCFLGSNCQARCSLRCSLRCSTTTSVHAVLWHTRWRCSTRCSGAEAATTGATHHTEEPGEDGARDHPAPHRRCAPIPHRRSLRPPLPAPADDAARAQRSRPPLRLSSIRCCWLWLARL